MTLWDERERLGALQESAVMLVSRLDYLFMTSDEIYDSTKL